MAFVIWSKASEPLYEEKTTVKLMLQRLSRIESFCLWAFGFLMILISLFSLYWEIQFPDASPRYGGGFISALTLSLATIMAAGLVGALTGFLFGIPRSLNAKNADSTVHDKKDVSKSPLLRTNTSIEDISSTLSTMLIGASLTQFNLVMENTYRMSLFLAYQLQATKGSGDQSLGNIGNYAGPLPSPYFFCLIIIAFIIGLFFAYVETRTRLTIFLIDNESIAYVGGSSVAEADESLIDPNKPTPSEFRLVDEPDPTSPQAGARQPIKPLSPTPEDTQRAENPLPDKPDDKVKWAVSKAKLGDYNAAVAALENVQSILPTSNTVISLISDVQSLSKNIGGAIDVVSKALQDKGIPNRQPLYRKLKQNLLNALYEPGGFDAAVKASDNLIEVGESSALDYVRRACALGQKYTYLFKQNASEDQLKPVVDATKEALDKVVELKSSDTATRELMSQLLQASGSDQDNDLVEIINRPEIQSELDRYLGNT